MAKVFAVAIVLLAVGSVGVAQDDDPWTFRVAIGKDGATSVGGKAIGGPALDEAIDAAAKGATGEGDRISEVHVQIACDGETPFAAFRRVFDSAVRARAYRFRATIGDDFVEFALVKDHGVKPTDAPEPRVLRAELCSTGDASAHSKDREGHSKTLAGERVAAKTWIWIDGDVGDPIDLSEDADAVARAAATMTNGDDELDQPHLEIAADPNVPMRHVFALIAALSPEGARSLAEMERMQKAGEPVMTEYGPAFTFTGVEEGTR